MTDDLTLPCLIHDLNNVFQTLLEAAGVLADDPQYAPLAAMIARSVERGRNITSSLRANGGARASLETILENAITFVQESAVAHRRPDVRFVREIEPGIEMESNWGWERVLVNLFSNAFRAMPEGGTIYVSARRAGGRVELIVRDEGPGIVPEILPDIFKPHVSTKSAGGLGLHIVETIVRQAKGEVRAANRSDGRGAEFTISVPAAGTMSARAANVVS